MATQTSVNNEFLNNVTVSESTAGTSAALLISNTDNSNTGSDAVLKVETGGASSGDAFVYFDNGVVDFTIGIDNSDDDSLVMSGNATPGTTNVARCTPDGEWTYPLQPGFNAHRTTVASNVTGNGATYTAILDTEKFDIGSDFNTGTGQFTAPVTGKYMFTWVARLFDQATMNTQRTILNTSNQSYFTYYLRESGSADSSSGGVAIVDMDSGDTAQMDIRATGEASDRLDFASNTVTHHQHLAGVLLQ